VCCGTKRLTEIHCPSDCVYLHSAREHPPAVAVRQQQHDVGILVHAMRDLSERQAQLFLFANTLLLRYQPPELQPLIDVDVADAAASLAATHETAARGVIYEHRPPSIAAERLVAFLKPALAEVGRNLGAAFDRDLAAVFRAIDRAIAAVRATEGAGRREYLDLVARMVRPPAPETEAAAPEPSRLIVP
jgi:hypothetical protein